MYTGANFSPCRKYRYNLFRIWDTNRKIITFCMLNPSTADETQNDPTIERCVRRAKMMNCGGLMVVNAFAYRSTDPNELYDITDPIGPENDDYIRKAAEVSGVVICGWGKHGSLHLRNHDVVDLIRETKALPLALRINKDGSPGHPLYIKYDQKPVNLITGEEYNVHRV